MTFKFKANIFQIDQTYWNLILMLLDTFAHEKKDLYNIYIFTQCSRLQKMLSCYTTECGKIFLIE